ncbi:MAG TPA: DUF5658 family protein [Steroidobacteraceae bacterium]|nr:DUF5658 family protein [Steroidobacteraceae bacterium]HRX90128.1 DUF5658 family protein [Steroidobacteraceae bacterium]
MNQELLEASADLPIDRMPVNRCGTPPERRLAGADRRQATLRALWVGSFARRRLGPRRDEDRSITSVDWHHPQWLAVSILILLLSCADAVLTLTLIHLGAEEVNPIMRPLVLGSGHAFASWKLMLTAGGVVTLTILARLRVFGRLPVGYVLYAVLAIYVVLIGYELALLERIAAEIASASVGFPSQLDAQLSQPSAVKLP